MRVLSMAVSFGVVCALASSSLGQSLNLRFGSAASTPSPNYGAVGLLGVWNSLQLTPDYTLEPLVDLQGNPIAAQYYQSGSSSMLSFDNPLTSGDDGKLMDSMILSSNNPSDGCFWIQGLALGTYEVTIYALTPNDPTLFTRTRVDNGSPGPTMVGGTWPGHHQEFVSFARFTVTTTDGTIAFHDGLAGAVIQSGMNGMQLEYFGACTPPSSYCTAKVNSNGCTPTIGWSGAPSASASSGFSISATNVLNNKSGLFFYSSNGQQAAPFQGGTLCVKLPLKRTALQSSNGNPPPNDCSGSYSIDFNEYVASGVDPALVAGSTIDGQYWARDPGFSAPNNTSLSNALHVTLCP